MHRFLAKPLDWLVIRAATAFLPRNRIDTERDPELEKFMEDPLRFLLGDPGSPELNFSTPRNFTFRSPVRTPWPENNTVSGKLYRCVNESERNPTVILLHGWNDNLGYTLRLPLYARLLNRSGLNAVIPRLPYHGPRRPQTRGAMRDFISSDPARMLEATRQAVLEIRALTTWLLDHKAGPVGLSGTSLGGWLGGLALCSDLRLRFGVLITPIVSIEQAIRDLPFCEPVRRALQEHPVRLNRMNLDAHHPKPPPERLLLIGARHDLFLPPEKLESLAAAWGNPHLWHFDHGHISVAFSVRLARKMAEWIHRTLAGDRE